MVDLMLDMDGTNNSTARKFFPTTTSHSIQGQRAVIYINFVSIDVAALVELISSSLHYLCYTSSRDIVLATS